mgnify:CR=1 FL=1
MDALQRIEELAKPVVVRQKEVKRKHLGVLNEEIRRGEGILGQLMPIETRAKDQVTQNLKDLAEKRRHLAIELAEFKCVSLEPLTWRRPDGLPTLAVFSLRFEHMALWNRRGKRDDDIQTHMSFCQNPRSPWENCGGAPEGIRLCYADLVSHRIMRAPQYASDPDNVVSTGFVGVIPFAVKEKIRQYRWMFDDVYLIAEPKSWMVHIPNPDPLVVGWDGGGFWLIDAFDTTTIEEAMLAMSDVDTAPRLGS